MDKKKKSCFTITCVSFYE